MYFFETIIDKFDIFLATAPFWRRELKYAGFSSDVTLGPRAVSPFSPRIL